MIYDIENSVYVENGDIFENENARCIFKKKNDNEVLVMLFYKIVENNPFPKDEGKCYALKNKDLIKFIKTYELKFIQNINTI